MFITLLGFGYVVFYKIQISASEIQTSASESEVRDSLQIADRFEFYKSLT